MEIERKFLIDKIPLKLTEYKSDKIKQGYFSILPEKRVRKLGDVYILTEKGEGDMIREEKEVIIDKEMGEKLFALSKTYIIEKTRYYIPFGEHIIELDVYEGRHKGMVVAEVEFMSEREALDFEPPWWFGEDITKDKSYKNMMLALNKG